MAAVGERAVFEGGAVEVGQSARRDVGPAVAARAGSRDEEAQFGQHLAPPGPQVVRDGLHGVPREERPDM